MIFSFFFIYCFFFLFSQFETTSLLKIRKGEEKTKSLSFVSISKSLNDRVNDIDGEIETLYEKGEKVESKFVKNLYVLAGTTPSSSLSGIVILVVLVVAVQKVSFVRIQRG